jgi:hypothetical protein
VEGFGATWINLPCDWKWRELFRPNRRKSALVLSGFNQSPAVVSLAADKFDPASAFVLVECVAAWCSAETLIVLASEVSISALFASSFHSTPLFILGSV